MQKVIVIFGAGQGLSFSVAQYYGQRGYQVALVSRHQAKLQKLADQLQSQNIKSAIFTADLTSAEQTQQVIIDIQKTLGSIHALYYAPNPQDGFSPAHTLTPEDLAPKVELYFYGLIRVVQNILPIFRENKGGLILSAVGGSAVNGFAFMSGLGPVMAASRNYLQSLQQELISEHIQVGLITISAQIENSASFVASQQHKATDETSPFPTVHPDELAELLAHAAQDDARLEACYP